MVQFKAAIEKCKQIYGDLSPEAVGCSKEVGCGKAKEEREAGQGCNCPVSLDGLYCCPHLPLS